MKANNEAEVSNEIKVTFDENLGAIADNAAFIDDLKVVVNGNVAKVTNIKNLLKMKKLFT